MPSRKHAKLRTLAPLVNAIDLRRPKAPAKVAAPFYLSPEWRALMEGIIRERGRKCQECGRTDCRVFGDHIIELADGGEPLNDANVLLRCGSCHSAKTAAVRAERMARRHVRYDSGQA